MTYPYQPGQPPELPPPNDPAPPSVPPPPMYYYPPPVYPYQPYQQPTEGLAIASLVVSCVAVAGLCAYGFGALLGPVGAILGHVARRRIAASGAGGDGLALAGIIIGWIMTALGVLAIVGILVVVLASESRTA